MGYFVVIKAFRQLYHLLYNVPKKGSKRELTYVLKVRIPLRETDV